MHCNILELLCLLRCCWGGRAARRKRRKDVRGSQQRTGGEGGGIDGSGAGVEPHKGFGAASSAVKCEDELLTPPRFPFPRCSVRILSSRATTTRLLSVPRSDPSVSTYVLPLSLPNLADFLLRSVSPQIPHPRRSFPPSNPSHFQTSALSITTTNWTVSYPSPILSTLIAVGSIRPTAMNLGRGRATISRPRSVPL